MTAYLPFQAYLRRYVPARSLATRQIFQQLENEGITPPRLLQILGYLGHQEHVPPAVRERLAAIASTSNEFQDIAELAPADAFFCYEVLQNYTDLLLKRPKYFSWSHHLLVLLRECIFTTLAVAAIFLLTLYLYDGRSRFFSSEHAVTALLSFYALLFVVFLLEGTQISIVGLRLKDLAAADRIPLAIKKLHQKYRDSERVQRYLAGRQLLIILAIFAISRICSFDSTAEVPVLGLTYPLWMQTWANPVLLEFGILAALVVLWLGQLIPQFVANKQPINFLAIAGARLIVLASRLIEMTGITDFSRRVTAAFDEEPEIPPSPREVVSYFAANFGFVQNCRLLDIELCRRDGVQGRIVDEFAVSAEAVKFIAIDEVIPHELDEVSTRWLWLRAGTAGAALVVDDESVVYTPNTLWRFRVRPREGGFRQGDVLERRSTFRIGLGNDPCLRFDVVRPLRFLLLRVTAPKDAGVEQVWLSTERARLVAGSGQNHVADFSPHQGRPGLETFHMFVPYPRFGEHYQISWRMASP